MAQNIKITITFSQSTASEKFKTWLEPHFTEIKADEWSLIKELNLGDNTYILALDGAYRDKAGEVLEKIVGCLSAGKLFWAKSYIVEDTLSDETRITAFKVLSRIESKIRSVFTKALAQHKVHAAVVLIDEEPDVTKKNKSLGPWYYAFTLNEYMQFLSAERAYDQHTSLSLGLVEHIFDSVDMEEAQKKIKGLKERKPIGELLFTDWNKVHTFFENKKIANIRNRVCHFHTVTDADILKLREFEKLIDAEIPTRKLNIAKSDSYAEFGGALARIQEALSGITGSFNQSLAASIDTRSITDAINKSFLDINTSAFASFADIHKGVISSALEANRSAFESIMNVNGGALEAFRRAAEIQLPSSAFGHLGLNGSASDDEKEVNEQGQKEKDINSKAKEDSEEESEEADEADNKK